MTKNAYAPPKRDADERRVGWVFTGEVDPARPAVLKYRYVPRLRPLVLALTFFSACLVFYVWRAWSNDRGLIINGLIELETRGATLFFATLAWLSAGFVAMGVWALVVRFRGPSYVVLDEEALSIPSRFGRKPKVATYSTIHDVQLLNVQGQSMLRITTDDRKLTIAGIMLASDEQLRELAEALARRRRQASDHPSG